MRSPVQLSKHALREGRHDRRCFSDVQRNPIYIVMDGLSCSHNVGCVFRMADAVLAAKVFLCGDSRKPPGKRISKGSRGAEKWVPWEYCEDITDALVALKASRVEIISMELCDSSVTYSQITYPSPVCFVIGSENKGVSPAALALSDRAIHLPMLGMSNSLNVSTATSVVLYDCLQKISAGSVSSE